MGLITVGISVKGKVQGVFFRKYTYDAAGKYDVKGFVRNENDGSVYAEVSGESDNVKDFIQWCYEGSPHSSVETVLVQEMAYKEYSDFKIRY